MEAAVDAVILEAVEAAGAAAELDVSLEQELGHLAAHPQPFPPHHPLPPGVEGGGGEGEGGGGEVVVEAPQYQGSAAQATISQACTLISTINRVRDIIDTVTCSPDNCSPVYLLLDHLVAQAQAAPAPPPAPAPAPYLQVRRLIEASTCPEFQEWEELRCSLPLTPHPTSHPTSHTFHPSPPTSHPRSSLAVVAGHPHTSDKMVMRCFLINGDNLPTFRLLQDAFAMDLDATFYMGKMNLLHIACDSGWSDLARELVRRGAAPEQRCPSLHMRPASLTPLMLAAGAGHLGVLAALLEGAAGLDTEARDGYGMTAVFHTCNHGQHRVGDQVGHFRRLWSWDLSPTQLAAMEVQARAAALPAIRLLLAHGADLHQRDKTGAGLLTRAASVDNFEGVVEFLVEAGCRVTENVLNWVRVRNPGVAARVAGELRTPAPLLRQARAAVWGAVRGAGARAGYSGRLEELCRGEQLPGVLGDYLTCRG